LCSDQYWEGNDESTIEVGDFPTHLISSPRTASYPPEFSFGSRSVWFSFSGSGFSSLGFGEKDILMSLAIDVTVIRRLMFSPACC
jgi:hypothetical protein